MKTQLKADLSLSLVALIWGGAYLLLKISLTELQVFNVIALRFLLAFFISGVVFYKRLRKINLETIKYAFLLAIFLFLIFITATLGVKLTSVSKAGFLISLTVVFVPLISYVFLKQRLEKNVLLAVALAVLGIGLLTLNGKVEMNLGDTLCIACAFISAIHLMLTGNLTRKVDSVNLGVAQLGFVGLFSIIFSVFTEIVRLPATPLIWFAVLFMSIFATAFAFIVQTTAQKHTSSVHASLIFSLDPVFCAIFAYAFSGEVLSLKGYVGAAILLLSILIVEVDFRTLFRKYT